MAVTLTNDNLKYRETPSDPWEGLLLRANISLDLFYPVGSIYMSTASTDPSILFGGTWQQLGLANLVDCNRSMEVRVYAACN